MPDPSATSGQKENVMKICIPAQDGQVLNAKVSPHFGRAPFYVVVDIESGELEVVPNGDHDHERGHCGSVEWVGKMGVDAIVCGGMGRRSLLLFESEGLAVFISRSPRVWKVLSEIQAGDVTRLRSGEASAGKHHPE